MSDTPAEVLTAGSAATTAGFYTATGSEPAKDLDAWVNYALDKAALATDTVLPIAKGGTGATTPAGARTQLGLSAAATATPSTAAGANTLVQRDGTGGIVGQTFWSNQQGAGAGHLTRKDYVDGAVAGKANTGYVDAAVAGKANTGYVDDVYRGYMSPDIYNRILAGSYRVAYVDANGTLGWVSSSRRYKKNIKPATVDPAAVLSMQLVTFLYRAFPDAEGRGEIQHGLIAEDLDALGLTWLVDYGADDKPEGVRYDRIALALLPVLQQQAARLDDLEQRLTALETHDDPE